MTFDARETSISDGQPVELYEFQMGLEYWRFTSGDEDVTHDGATYLREVITSPRIEASVEIQRGNITLTVARTMPIAELFRIGQPPEIVLVVIRRIHRGETEDATVWMGRVLNVNFSSDVSAEITCESIHSSLKRIGLRRPYQRNCPHVVYSQGDGLCNADEASKRETASLTAVSGRELTSGIFGLHPDGYYAGGMVEWESSPGRVERRAISNSAAGVIVISYPFKGLPTGANVIVIPGCDHTLDGPFGCVNLHANSDNYGGQPYIPIINPFSGTSVF